MRERISHKPPPPLARASEAPEPDAAISPPLEHRRCRSGVAGWADFILRSLSLSCCHAAIKRDPFRRRSAKGTNKHLKTTKRPHKPISARCVIWGLFRIPVYIKCRCVVLLSSLLAVHLSSLHFTVYCVIFWREHRGKGNASSMNLVSFFFFFKGTDGLRRRICVLSSNVVAEPPESL